MWVVTEPLRTKMTSGCMFFGRRRAVIARLFLESRALSTQPLSAPFVEKLSETADLRGKSLVIRATQTGFEFLVYPSAQILICVGTYCALESCGGGIFFALFAQRQTPAVPSTPPAIFCHHAFSPSEHAAKTTPQSFCLEINLRVHPGCILHPPFPASSGTPKIAQFYDTLTGCAQRPARLQ